MPRNPVNREEQGKLIAKTSGSISMINRSMSGNNTYTVTATNSEYTCSCPDYACHNARCKHVYAVEIYCHQNTTF
ncbi:MAG TPA: SWIM zinc finger family protein [Nitrososphaeraceae archaeon]